MVQYKRKWIFHNFIIIYFLFTSVTAKMRTSFNGYVKQREFSICNMDQLQRLKSTLIAALSSPLKFFLILTAYMIKGERIIQTTFRHKVKSLINEEEKELLLEEALRDIQTHMETYLRNGSGWSLHQYDKVCNFYNFLNGF